ncbi:MAG: hypothetical protein ACKN9T_16275 [Candidatus Methylumidiphilus sp.]
MKPDVKGAYGSYPQSQGRLKLLDYAKTGMFGIGEEKASFFRDHPTPCAELWQRIAASGGRMP